MKGIVLILAFFIIIGIAGMVGLYFTIGVSPWVRGICGGYMICTVIFLLIMIIAAPKMAKMMKGKNDK